MPTNPTQTEKRTKMCIYQIMRNDTGEKYIGQTIKNVGIRWNKHCTRDKLSKFQKGRTKSEDHCRKISEAQIGKVIAPEAESKRLLAWVAHQAKKDEINPPTEKQLATRLYYKNLRAKNKLQKENL